jgi:site-specific recombinase XerD
MINKGVKIQDLKEMMGHESIETTNSYYIFSNVARIRSECKIHAA